MNCLPRCKNHHINVRNGECSCDVCLNYWKLPVSKTEWLHVLIALLSVLLIFAAGRAWGQPAAPSAIAATGYTNTMGIPCQVVYGGTTVSSWIKRSGALTSTNDTIPMFSSGNCTVPLLAGDALVISGTGVSGRAIPFPFR